MTTPRKTTKPGTDPILIALVILVSLFCLFPTLIGDLISLTTDPDDMPSSICLPPSGWAILVMFGRELIFVLTAVFSSRILAHLGREGKFPKAILVWGIPVAAFIAIILLTTMGLPTPLKETPVCTGPADQPKFGYPYAWVMHPGRWTTYIDAYGFQFHSFSFYPLLVNIIFLANLGICMIGGIMKIRKESKNI